MKQTNPKMKAIFLKFKKHFKKLLFLSIIGFSLIIGINVYVKNKTNHLIYNNINEVQNTNVGIIFGAGINGDKPSKYLKDRLDAGILLYKSRKINKILLSGDNGSDEHDELTVMKNYCYQNGVDTTKIYIDYAGFDTYSTIFRAKNIFKIKNTILVSQKYHLNRAIFIGNKIGIKSTGFSANVGQYNNYNYVKFREYFSVVRAFFDVSRKRKPRFLGTEININGASNYSKDDKR
jgi:SanA protein